MLAEVKNILELEARVGRRVYKGNRGGFYYMVGKRKYYIR